MRALTRSLSLLILAALPLERGAAQRVLGPAPDAYTLPRGAIRTTLSGQHDIFTGRWNEGVLEPLGGAFSTLQFGETHSFALRELNAEFAALGVSGLDASLGATRLDLRQRIFATHFGLEYGLFDWLTLGVDAPWVRTRAEAALRLDGSNGLATAGVNPIRFGSGVAGTNATTVQAYVQAAAALTTRRDDCIANAAAHPECPEILAEATDVNALIALTSTFATGLANTYGTSVATAGMPFVPMAGSAGEQALLARVDSMRNAMTRYGVTEITPTTGLPLGAQAPLSSAQLAAMVDSGFGGTGGYGARPMTRTAREGLGDIDLTLRAKLFDSFARSSRGVRQTVALTYRLGNGERDRPEQFIDLGTGAGSDAIALRSYTDLALNKWLAATVTLGWSRALPFSTQLRAPSVAGIAWLEAWRLADVDVTPGSVIELGVAPQWQLSDYFAVGAAWRWRRKSADQHENIALASPLVTPLPLVIDGAFLDAGTEHDEQRLAFTLSYSTLAATSDSRVRLPFELGYTHERSLTSARGVFPRTRTDRLQIRYYARFLAR